MPVDIQTLTIEAIKLYGHGYNLERGVCYGISLLANDAIFQEPSGITEFTARFLLLERHYNPSSPTSWNGLLEATQQAQKKVILGGVLSRDDRLLSEMPSFVKKIGLLQDENNRVILPEKQ